MEPLQEFKLVGRNKKLKPDVPHKCDCQGEPSTIKRASSTNLALKKSRAAAIQADPPNEQRDDDEVPESGSLINSSDQLVDDPFTQHSPLPPSTDKAVLCVLPQIDKGVQSHIRICSKGQSFIN